MALVGVSGSEEDADAEAPDPAPAHPDEIIDRAELRRRLVESLGKLPPEERAIIDAVYFEGEPMSDYADRVGVHKSTICRRHARAITRLATTIGSPPRRRGPPPSGG
jgi:RNA polymerase sigma factor (sigma-70 family)